MIMETRLQGNGGRITPVRCEHYGRFTDTLVTTFEAAL
jgi:hypothetical protein